MEYKEASADESLEEGQLVDTPLKKSSWKRFTHHPWRKLAEDRWGNRSFDTSSSEGYKERFTTSHPQAQEMEQKQNTQSSEVIRLQEPPASSTGHEELTGRKATPSPRLRYQDEEEAQTEENSQPDNPQLTTQQNTPPPAHHPQTLEQVSYTTSTGACIPPRHLSAHMSVASLICQLLLVHLAAANGPHPFCVSTCPTWAE